MMTRGRIIDDFLYLPFRGYAGAVTWSPAAFRDPGTGRVYGLLAGLTNDEAQRLWEEARR